MINKCKDCKYFKRLGKNKEAWGECLYFGFNKLPVLPFWSEVRLKYGSISPEHDECKTFRGLNDE